MDGDIYQGRTVELTQEYPSDKTNYPKGKDWGQGAMHSLSLKPDWLAVNGDWIVDNELSGHVIQWHIWRIAELYLSYAEVE